MNGGFAFFSTTLKPIEPAKEMGAYEALWMEPGASFKKIAKLFKEKLYRLPSELVPEHLIEKFKEQALSILVKRNIKHFGIKVFGAVDYPKRLRDAQHPVELLYYQGYWDLVNTRSIAVVGSRDATELGIKRTKKLVKHLVNDGFTIVSGLARGIDTAAHTTAIKEGGNTIAVIGTPLSYYYPKENAYLQKEIATNHLLISQVPIIRYSRQNFKTNRFFFPERNITMSALTEATVIVEASERSGTLYQARAALKQGRKLFILKSCLDNPNITWPRRFLNQGAILVEEYVDIKRALLPLN